MKRDSIRILMAISLSLVLILSGCGGKSPAEKNPAEKEEEISKEEIDVDLTTHSSTIVYAEVYNMMANPYDYYGQVIKMRGEIATYRSEADGLDHYGCLIKDATACCTQGIEFYLKETYSYPDDYPEVGTECSVVGTFDVTEDGNFLIISLKDADLVEE